MKNKLVVKNRKYYFWIILASIASYFSSASSLTAADAELEFFFDATAFSSDSVGHSRIDIAAAIPYQMIKFEDIEGIFLANCVARIVVSDSNDRTAAEYKTTRKLKANSLFVAQGGSGDFDYFFKSFILPAGDYKVKIIITDELAGMEYEKQRRVSLLDFKKFELSMSGTLLVSKIEQVGSSFKITPFLSDNIAPVINSLFTVMEIYNKNAADSIDFIYVLYNKANTEILKSEIITKFVPQGKSSLYFPIKGMKGLKQGETYILRTYALKPGANPETYNNFIVAGSERSIEYKRQIGKISLDNIDLAIEQSFYAAYPDDMRYMREGKDNDDKLDRFLKFWKSLDPTPNTERNEALDEYFRRIETASKRFRSSSRGENWRSDMAAAYVVYGPPLSTERGTPDYMGRVYERWNYSNGQSLYFLDQNGFGDFRLVQPAVITEKYRFK